jgi:hypothetical protein
MSGNPLTKKGAHHETNCSRDGQTELEEAGLRCSGDPGKRTLFAGGEILRFDGHLTSAEHALVDSAAGVGSLVAAPGRRHRAREEREVDSAAGPGPSAVTRSPMGTSSGGLTPEATAAARHADTPELSV